MPNPCNTLPARQVWNDDSALAVFYDQIAGDEDAWICKDIL
ncbi:MAG: hypothetical protein WBN81_04185 [Gammaproteobacteria bacterium]